MPGNLPVQHERLSIRELCRNQGWSGYEICSVSGEGSNICGRVLLLAGTSRDDYLSISSFRMVRVAGIWCLRRRVIRSGQAVRPDHFKLLKASIFSSIRLKVPIRTQRGRFTAKVSDLFRHPVSALATSAAPALLMGGR